MFGLAKEMPTYFRCSDSVENQRSFQIMRSKMSEAVVVGAKAQREHWQKESMVAGSLFQNVYWTWQMIMSLWQSGQLVRVVVQQSQTLRLSPWASYNLFVFAFSHSGAFLTVCHFLSKTCVEWWHGLLSRWKLCCFFFAGAPFLASMVTHVLPFFVFYPFFLIAPGIIGWGGSTFDLMLKASYDDWSRHVIEMFLLFQISIVVFLASSAVSIHVYAGEVYSSETYFIPFWNEFVAHAAEDVIPWCTTTIASTYLRILDFLLRWL